MNFQRTFAIALRQFYLVRGSLTRFFPLFMWVALDIILWGFISRYLNSVTSPGFNFIPVFLGAILLWDFLIRVMQGVTIAFFEDVWSRNFLNVFASPLTIPDYLGGLVITAIATSLVGLIAMLVLATFVFGLSFAAYGLVIIPALLVLFLFGIALGIFGSALVLRFGPASEWLIWPIPPLLSPFVGVFYPISTLPHWMQLISRILPPSYIFENLRAVLAGTPVSNGDIITGIVMAIFYILLACWFFAYVYRHAIKTGLIARYSAESLS